MPSIYKHNLSKCFNLKVALLSIASDGRHENMCVKLIFHPEEK